PTGASVRGDQQLEPPPDGVAQGDAVFLIPEGDGVKKSSGVGTPELQRPRLAAVDRLVNARSVAGSGAEQVGRHVAERLDIAKVEFFRTGHGPDGPALAAVGGACVGAPGSADPGDVRAHDAKAAQVGLRAAGLYLPLGGSEGAAQADKARREGEAFHG